MKIQRPISILMALCFAVTFAFTQNAFFKSIPNFELTNKGVQIIDMTQDPQGYIWFATDKGLYRYNGYETTIYLIEDNTAATNIIRSVYADDQGLIWFSSIFSGLHCLDPKTGVFKHFQPNPNDPSSLSSEMINDILKDKKGFLWVATSKGLNRLDINTGKFIRFLHNDKVPTSLSDNDVNVLYEDKKGILWVGTEGGLNIFNPTNGQFIKFLHDPNNPQTLIDNSVKAIFEDSRGIFWVGTEGDGLHTMNRANGIFQRLTHNPTNPNQISSHHTSSFITFIKEDAAKRMWIGGNTGINIYDFRTNKMLSFDIQKDSLNGLANSEISASLISKDSILWISTVDGLVYQIDPYFKKIAYKVTDIQIGGMQKEPSGITWFLNFNELIKRDLRTGEIKRFTHNPDDSQSLSLFPYRAFSNKRFSVGKNNKLWIATNAYGVDCFDKQSEKVAHFKHIPNNPSTIMNDTVDFVHEEGDNLWIGSKIGLDWVNLKTGKFMHYLINSDSTGLVSRFVSSVLTENKDKIWIGAVGGLNLLNPMTGKFKYYLKGIPINCILKDVNGIIWLGTDYGLYKYDVEADKFAPFRVAYGQTISVRVEDIQEDERKNLWVGSQNALFRINPSRDFIKILGAEDGIVVGEQCERGFGTKGEILFIEGKGYYSITEGDVRSNPFPPQIVISDLQIGGQSMNNGGHQSHPFSDNKEMVLSYNQNVFSFNIVPIHYSNSMDNQVLFQLENYDTEWRTTDGEKRASYINVPPGEYIFKVKAFNSSGLWFENKYLITITPPWWKTWWAYLIYVVALLLAIRAYTRYRSRTLKEENALLEKRVNQRTKELAQKSTELEKSLTELKATQTQLIQSEKLASLGELTAGIAHEIQNPLNFVNNFSELSIELIDELKSPLTPKGGTLEAELLSDISQNLEKINHHGKRASNIVKGMLEHSRTSSGTKEPTNINALIRETLPLSYHALRAKDKTFNADFKMDLDDSIGEINIIPQDMSRVFINLFNNAFYAVNQKKQVSDSLPLTESYIPSVLVSTQKIGNQIVIKINDNGTGMPESVRAKVFQPFFTTKPTGQGTGLGLSLAYDIVTKGHGGSLEVESTEGVGTEFIIRLPLGKQLKIGNENI